MKKNNFWKRFWTMDVHNHEGFTLVELIIVIAILAILSSVAVVGYSAYIKKANKQADVTLAAEIENALTLAMYSGELTSGDYVVIKYNGTAVAKNANDESILTAAAAMEAAFGAGWENSLKLKWDGWTVGVAGDAEKMDMVFNSNFSPEKMDVLLGQLQGVVGDASFYLEDRDIAVSAEIAEIMKQNGIDIEAGTILNEDTSMAAANAYVFLVAGQLGVYDVQMDDEGNMSPEGETFIAGWAANNFDGASMDPVAAAAAKYASVLALAKYVDSKAGTTYENQLNVSADPRDDADLVLAAIQSSDNSDVQNALITYYAEGENGEIGAFYNDAMAFLTYMQGVSDSSDNLLQNTDLSNGQYFVDGYVSDYVNSYLSISDVLAGADFEGSAMAFFFVGDDIVCMFSEK